MPVVKFKSRFNATCVKKGFVDVEIKKVAEEGKKAFKNNPHGDCDELNPHPWGSLERASWLKGWFDASHAPTKSRRAA